MSKINDLLEEAKARVMTLPSYKNRVIIVYDEDDLIDEIKATKGRPMVGVVYEGMRSVSDENKPTSKIGASVEVVIGLILVQQGDAQLPLPVKKINAHEALEIVRNLFLGTRSTTTNHFWHFLIETPVDLKSGVACWTQRWSVPMQLTTGAITPL